MRSYQFVKEEMKAGNIYLKVVGVNVGLNFDF